MSPRERLEGRRDRPRAPRPDIAACLGEVRVDQALADSDDGAFVIGADGRIVLWNRAAERILAYTASEVIGRRCGDIFVGRDHDRNRVCYQGGHAKMGEPIQTFDMQTRTKAGTPVWINVSILVVPDNSTAGTLTIHLFREVTTTRGLLTFVQEQLSPPAPDAGPAALGGLTRRELELLRLLALGLNTMAAAKRLRVSQATIRNHVQNIFGKLGVHSRLEAVAHANRHRLL